MFVNISQTQRCASEKMSFFDAHVDILINPGCAIAVKAISNGILNQTINVKLISSQSASQSPKWSAGYVSERNILIPDSVTHKIRESQHPTVFM